MRYVLNNAHLNTHTHIHKRTHTDQEEEQQRFLTASPSKQGNNKNNTLGSSFSLRLTKQSLDIVEINAFKTLTHLSLTVRKGNDVEVKMYLAARLEAERTTSSSLRTELQRMSKELQNTHTNLKRTTALLQDANSNLKKVKDEIELSIKTASQRIQEEANERLKLSRQSHERVVNELRERSESERAEYKSETDRLRHDVTKWREQSFQFESRLKSTNASLVAIRKDYKQSSDLNDALKLDLETLREEQLKTVRELQSKLLHLAKLEQSLKDKDRVLSTLREIAENAKRERDQSEASSKQFEISNKRLQDQLERSVKEIRKGMLTLFFFLYLYLSLSLSINTHTHKQTTQVTESSENFKTRNEISRARLE